MTTAKHTSTLWANMRFKSSTWNNHCATFWPIESLPSNTHCTIINAHQNMNLVRTDFVVDGTHLPLFVDDLRRRLWESLVPSSGCIEFRWSQAPYYRSSTRWYGAHGHLKHHSRRPSPFNSRKKNREIRISLGHMSGLLRLFNFKV